jgi:hypothetical protein
VGLVNARRQLVARYENRARLTLEGREPRGARATIAIPLDRIQVVSASVRDSPEPLC